ncbi:MAG: transport-associated protein [Gammaproteobacteria bacterium]
MKLSKSGKTIASALLVSALLIPLSACEKQGPLEEAGEAIDDKVEEVGDAVEDATDDG